MNGHTNVETEMANHLAFQMSLLRLSLVAEPEARRPAATPQASHHVAAEKLAELVAHLPLAGRQ